ncbi:MAG TPA: response regulator [Planctomycetes bacterium]|nr:response regulator [Planctomycetota bacterium]
MVSSSKKFLSRSLLLLSLYLLLAFVGLSFAPPGQATWVWPAAGVGFASVLLLGTRGLLVPCLGGFLATLLFGREGLRNFPLFLVPPVAEAFVGWVFLRWTRAKKVPLLRSKDVILFLLAAFFASLVGTGLGVGLSFGGGGNLSGGFTWFFGDLAGILVITPLLLMFLGLPSRRWSGGVKKGILPLSLSIGVFLVLGFYLESFEGFLPFPWEFLALPVVFIAAWLLRLPGLVLADFFLYVGSISHFAFGALQHPGGAHFSLPQVQSFIILVAGMGLVLNGFLEEQAGLLRRTELSERRLRKTLQQLQKGMDREIALFKERMEYKDELRQSKRAKALGQRAGEILHDYSNMMAALIGHVEQAKRFVGRGENPEATFEVLSNGLYQAEILGRRILAESDGAEVLIQALAAGEIVREVFQLWKVLLPPGVRVKLEIGEDLPQVFGDPVWLRQAVLNLLGNAREAVGPRGSIEIRVFTREGTLEEREGLWSFGSGSSHLCIQVKDDGIGMGEELRNKVLEPFFSTKGEGHGFGLSSVVQGMEHLKGAIQIQSTPGKGTEVTLFLPLEDRVHRIPAVPPKGRREIAFSRKHRILVIEDDPHISEVFQRILEEAGCDVLAARNWHEGEAMLREGSQEISLVLLDWSLPDVRGSEALDRLSEAYGEIPIVLASGFRERELSSLMEAFRQKEGARLQYLAKPFRPQQLLQLLRELLEDVEKRPLDPDHA